MERKPDSKSIKTYVEGGTDNPAVDTVSLFGCIVGNIVCSKIP